MGLFDRQVFDKPRTPLVTGFYVPTPRTKEIKCLGKLLDEVQDWQNKDNAQYKIRLKILADKCSELINEKVISHDGA